MWISFEQYTLIDKLIEMTCQPILGYFIALENCMHLCLQFLCSYLHMVQSNMNTFRLNLFDLLMRPLTGTSTPSQSRSGSNGNDGLFHTPQISRTGALPSTALSARIVEYVDYTSVVKPPQLGHLLAIVSHP